MLLGECYAGEDAEVLFEAMKSDWSAEDEDVISNLVVYVKQYKETPVQVTGATALWDSDMGMYLLTIPAAYVPASGSFDIVVKGAGDIDDAKIRLGVNTADSVLSSLSTSTELGNVGANVVAIKDVIDLLTTDPLAAIKAQAAGALTDFDTATPIAKTSELTSINVDTTGLATTEQLNAAITELKGSGWTDETLKTLMDAIESISVIANIDAEDIVDAIFNTHLDSSTYDTDKSFGNIIWKLYRVRNYKV